MNKRIRAPKGFRFLKDGEEILVGDYHSYIGNPIHLCPSNGSSGYIKIASKPDVECSKAGWNKNLAYIRKSAPQKCTQYFHCKGYSGVYIFPNGSQNGGYISRDGFIGEWKLDDVYELTYPIARRITRKEAEKLIGRRALRTHLKNAQLGQIG